jgi:tetratricopeptide (TPR) repeat protein
LSPLLLDANQELEINDRLGPGGRAWAARFDDPTVRTYLIAKLSQYARFSLAKAGIAGPIDSKIALLRERAGTALERARTPRLSFGDNDFVTEQAWREAMELYFELGYHHQQLDHYDEAEAAYRVVIDGPEPNFSKQSAWYNLACIRALQGRKEEALEALENAVNCGFGDAAWARRDGDLQSLRDDPRFQKILDGR